jgi:hypothetical protein
MQTPQKMFEALLKVVSTLDKEGLSVEFQLHAVGSFETSSPVHARLQLFSILNHFDRSYAHSCQKVLAKEQKRRGFGRVLGSSLVC